MELGGGDDGLATFEGFYEVELPFFVEFGEDIVEEEHWKMASEAFDKFDFGELDGEEEGAEFAAGGGGEDIVTVERENKVVAVGANGGFGADDVYLAARVQSLKVLGG